MLHVYVISCVSHPIDICTVAIENIRNMHAVSTNKTVDILKFNDNQNYATRQHSKLKQGFFTQQKHLESRVKNLWDYFKVIKRYNIHHSMKWVPIPRKQVIKVYSDTIF